uniref:NS protein n=1 Tax=Avian orthoreovirus TaxID=38170 RepID=A0A385JBD5_9REOV|nr:NS protein [Avian orthoreovirus]
MPLPPTLILFRSFKVHSWRLLSQSPFHVQVFDAGFQSYDIYSQFPPVCDLSLCYYLNTPFDFGIASVEGRPGDYYILFAGKSSDSDSRISLYATRRVGDDGSQRGDTPDTLPPPLPLKRRRSIGDSDQIPSKRGRFTQRVTGSSVETPDYDYVDSNGSTVNY